MKKSTLNASIWTCTRAGRVRDEFATRREQGSISVETVVIALGLFALATLIIGLLTVWATGKLGGLS
ncbi:hypothetical protein [Ornithinimicrobium cryptoxanthini]|uniref:Uncharacterized protein n=1 Tax=Ornithinimicrobium cryptoxanthini TaxID=2934161 RepID=A0ABY4YLX1_9MICO|nr:hypothetical protein [Ornithinimicrobium cryptoxanthini]USQ77785.1 hypothetical protein NF557_07790 [Ornithinimicrobium cryptoxanthini]